MKVPLRRFELAGLVCEPREKSDGVVQGHIVKHPLGVTSIVRGGAWNAERWDELGVVDQALRAQFLAAVRTLRAGAAECAVPELRGESSARLDAIACDVCPGRLAATCAELTRTTIAARYFRVLDDVLTAASGAPAVQVEKSELLKRMFASLRAPGTLSDLVVMFAGVDGRQERHIVVRLNRGDGVRAELYYEEPDRLVWRTLYRDPRAVATLNGRVSFLLDAPPQGKSSMPLSELCLVSRPFWQTS